MSAIAQPERARMTRRIARALGVMTIAAGIAMTTTATGAVAAARPTTEVATTTLQLHNNEATNYSIGQGECADVQFPSTSVSYWHFVVSGSTESFVSITLDLGSPVTSIMYTSASPGVIFNGKQAYIPVPAGATLSSLLLSSTAEVSPVVEGDLPNFNLSHTCTAAVPPPPPPVDVCNNIADAQATIPAGMISDGQGGCVTPPVDVCKNLVGNQTSVPAGYTSDAEGTCTPIPPVDVCNNIGDAQATIPAGMISDGHGGCVTPASSVVLSSPPAALDLCSNIVGDQAVVPTGTTAANGVCTQVASEAVAAPADVTLPVTGTDTASGIAIGMALVGAGLALSALARRRTAQFHS